MAGAMGRISDHNNDQSQTQNTFLGRLFFHCARDGLKRASEPSRRARTRFKAIAGAGRTPFVGQHG